MDWFWKSILSAVILVPGFLTVPFFGRNFKIPAEVVLVYYFFGIAIGCFTQTLGFQMASVNALKIPILVALAIAASGFIFGAGSNVLLFGAMVEAPHAGVAVAMLGLTLGLTFLATAFLGLMIPQYFEVGQWNGRQFLGAAIIVAGVFVVGLSR